MGGERVSISSGEIIAMFSSEKAILARDKVFLSFIVDQDLCIHPDAAFDIYSESARDIGAFPEKHKLIRITFVIQKIGVN